MLIFSIGNVNDKLVCDHFLLKSMLEGVRGVARPIYSHEQTQLNQVCRFLILYVSLFLNDPFSILFSKQ